jgi:hypothetical protein
MTERDQVFDVCWWDKEGGLHREKTGVSAKTAVETAHSLTRRPAVQLGIIQTVMIIDRGDSCVFKWQYGQGVVWPPAKEDANVQ